MFPDTNVSALPRKLKTYRTYDYPENPLPKSCHAKFCHAKIPSNHTQAPPLSDVKDVTKALRYTIELTPRWRGSAPPVFDSLADANGHAADLAASFQFVFRQTVINQLIGLCRLVALWEDESTEEFEAHQEIIAQLKSRLDTKLYVFDTPMTHGMFRYSTIRNMRKAVVPQRIEVVKVYPHGGPSKERRFAKNNLGNSSTPPENLKTLEFSYAVVRNLVCIRFSEVDISGDLMEETTDSSETMIPLGSWGGDGEFVFNMASVILKSFSTEQNRSALPRRSEQELEGQL
ncbi:hypothetical protein FPQ18DRAFT_389801 [Pyronema domesticum]|uniref:Uncharacterized protein n=1 Tax=Pyronema omphalodes (strain CBS 100304) TaxID=1076935 RepID=U4L6Y0_PYROM|nr:hypothetical protein FPQ18DRAFT_389801 [Pyronema domesticum]CCX13149.1 Protein of unknown function [Pyronema omphalodes CBS 100304]